MPDDHIPLHTTRELSKQYGVGIDCVRRLVDRLGLGQRVGRNRVLSASDVPSLETALRAGAHRDRVRREGGHA
jgi:hypothetical protein